MTWVLLSTSGAILARGSYSTVLAAAKERHLARVLTCGAATGDPAWMPQMTSRDYRILPEAMVGRDARRAA